jgi:hypothetical protein
MKEIEQALRRIVREELAKLIGIEPEQIAECDDADLRARVQERAAAMRKARAR